MEETDSELTRHVLGIQKVMAQTYGTECEATREAGNEIGMVASKSPSEEGILCKRALLLFALHREPELMRYFKSTEQRLTEDLVERVLPFIDPPFLSNSCQAPESYVFLSVILSEMFAGEKLGNWPLEHITTTAPEGV